MKFIVLFKLRTKQKAAASEFHFIYARLTVDGKPTSDFTTGVKCKVSDWDRKAQQIKGNNELTRQQNQKLTLIKSDLDTIYNDLRKSDKTITAQIIKQIYTKKAPNISATLLAYFELYMNKELKPIIEESTLDTWKSRKNTLEGYVKSLKRKDVDLIEVTPKWLKEYYFYHLNTLENCKNHAARAVQAVKRVMDFAVEEEALPYNPTLSLKVKKDPKKPIKYLTVDDIEKLTNCPYYPERLQRVVDTFLIQCRTGMAYGEMRAFNAKAHLHHEKSGVTFIKVYRGKTKELCLIPLLKDARRLLEKYDYKPQIITNQRMNDFIKEAAQMAGLEKWESISTHVGRSTAGTFLLNNGVEIKIVSKILGHRSVVITETYYAELLTATISKSVLDNDLV